MVNHSISTRASNSLIKSHSKKPSYSGNLTEKSRLVYGEGDLISRSQDSKGMILKKKLIRYENFLETRKDQMRNYTETGFYQVKNPGMQFLTEPNTGTRLEEELRDGEHTGLHSLNLSKIKHSRSDSKIYLIDNDFKPVTRPHTRKNSEVDDNENENEHEHDVMRSINKHEESESKLPTQFTLGKPKREAYPDMKMVLKRNKNEGVVNTPGGASSAQRLINKETRPNRWEDKFIEEEGKKISIHPEMYNKTLASERIDREEPDCKHSKKTVVDDSKKYKNKKESKKDTRLREKNNKPRNKTPEKKEIRLQESCLSPIQEENVVFSNNEFQVITTNDSERVIDSRDNEVDKIIMQKIEKIDNQIIEKKRKKIISDIEVESAAQIMENKLINLSKIKLNRKPIITSKLLDTDATIFEKASPQPEGKLEKKSTITPLNRNHSIKTALLPEGLLRLGTDSPKKFAFKISVIPPQSLPDSPEKRLHRRRLKRTSTLSINFHNQPSLKGRKDSTKHHLSVKSKFTRNNTQSINSGISSATNSLSASVCENTSSVGRFINNYSLSILNKIQFLVYTLQEDITNISSDQKTVDLEKLNFLRLLSKSSKTTAKKQRSVMKKRMKIELNIALKPLKRNFSTRETEKNKSSIIENIKQTLMSEGIKNDLISYVRKTKNINRASMITEMGKIIKKRINHAKTDSDSSSGTTSSDFSDSSSDSGGSEISHIQEQGLSKFDNERRRNLDKLRYEMSMQKSIKSERSTPNIELNRSMHGAEDDYFSNASVCGNSFLEFEENNADIQYELGAMTWCNKGKNKHFLFSPQVNYTNVDRDMLMCFKEVNNIDFDDEDGIDVRNLESTVLKNRFLMKHMELGSDGRYYSNLVVTSPENLDPEERKRVDMEAIRKHYRRLRYIKLNKKKALYKKETRTFSNIRKNSLISKRRRSNKEDHVTRKNK